MVGLVALLVFLIQPSDVVGSYRADIASAPKKSRGVFEAIYGCTILRLEPDGTFQNYIGHESWGGFWRREGDRVILINQGFLNIPFPIPDDVLRVSTPKNHGEGVQLRVGAGGTLVLSEFGRAAGPLVFRKLPRRSTLELLRLASADEPTGEGSDAYETLASDASRVDELLGFVNDGRQKYNIRFWAATILGSSSDDTQLPRLLQTLLDLKQGRLDDREFRSLRHIIWFDLSTRATLPTARALRSALTGTSYERFCLARAYGWARFDEGLAELTEWLGAETPSVRRESCNALRLLAARDRLPELRRMRSDPDASVAVAAHHAVIALSPDPEERAHAVADVAKLLLATRDFLKRDVVEAIASDPVAGVPYLANLLENDPDLEVRRNAVVHLGEIGSPAAVHALMMARSWLLASDTEPYEFDPDPGLPRRVWDEGTVKEYAELRKALVEALWSLSKKDR